MRKLFVSWQWLFSFGLTAWFLFIHSPPVWIERGAFRRPEFFLHLLGAYVMYGACLHNTLYNPFLVTSRHARVGQVGLLCGAVAFALGVASIAATWDEIDRGFAVGITVGGVFQMQLQYQGYRAIQRYKQAKDELQRLSEKAGGSDRGAQDGNGSTSAPMAAPSTSAELDEHRQRQILLLRDEQGAQLRTHVGCMVALLVNGCGMPAAMRLVERIGLGSGVPPILLALGLLHVLLKSHLRSINAQLPLDGKKDS